MIDDIRGTVASVEYKIDLGRICKLIQSGDVILMCSTVLMYF